MMQSKNVQLAVISFLILFLELVLIKLIGTEIRIFSYVPNLILLATFIGSGLGFLFKKEIPVYHSALGLTLTVMAISMPMFQNITDLLSSISDSYIWFPGVQTSMGRTFMGIVLTVVLFTLVMYAFIPLGKYLSKLFSQSKNITATYSINVLFSLLGILAFNSMSYFRVSPYISLVVSLILIICLTEKKKMIFGLACLIIMLPFLLTTVITKGQLVWSPYQKLQLTDLPAMPNLPPGKMLRVNNVGYMGLLDLSEEYQSKMPDILKTSGLDISKLDALEYRNQYDLPYKLAPARTSVLLIGAGAGNDAAGALRFGVEKITAVEIDPSIIEFGRKYHPEKPYDNPKVTIINDDGRAFLQRTKEKYNVVIMGLTDSHSLNSSLTNIQLDNFLYTAESLEAVHSVLAEDGLLFLSFDVWRDWIGQRIKASITEAFGAEPLIFTTQRDPQIFGWGGVYFIAPKNPDYLNNLLSQDEELKNYVQKRKIDYQTPNKYLTDDWPYLYLKGNTVPKIHLYVSVALILMFLSIFYMADTVKRFNRQAFFMGAAFMLYEFQNIGRTSLIFGNTWKTNVLIISAILILILCANLLYMRVKVPLRLSFTFLILSFSLQFFIPAGSLVSVNELVKLTLIPIIINLPLFFAGLMFITFFEKAKDRNSFYGSNLLGSAVGGLFSYLSYVFGIKALIFLSLFFYLLVMIESIWTVGRNED